MRIFIRNVIQEILELQYNGMPKLFGIQSHNKEDVFKLKKLEKFSKVVIVNGDDTCEMCNKAPNLVHLELGNCGSMGQFVQLSQLFYIY